MPKPAAAPFARPVVAAVLGAGLLAAVLPLTGCKTAVSYRAEGFRAMQEGDKVKAVEKFEKSVEARSTDFQAQYWLGVNLLQTGEPIRAQAPLEQALALRPDDPVWRPRIADAVAESYLQQGLTEKLYGFLDNQIVTYGQQTPDFMRKAKYLGKIGDSDGQRRALEKAGYFAPKGDLTPYLALADFYAAVNDVPNEVQALKYAYFTDPSADVVKNRLRGLGIIPGPTVSAEPPKAAILE